MGSDGASILWDLAGRRELRRLPDLGGGVGRSALINGDDSLIAAISTRSAVGLFRVSDGGPVRSLPLGGPGLSGAFSTDGRRLALGDERGQVRVFSVPDGELALQIQTEGTVTGVSLDSSGARVLSWGWGREEARVHRVSDGELIAGLAPLRGGPVAAGGFCAAGEVVFLAGEDGSLITARPSGQTLAVLSEAGPRLSSARTRAGSSELLVKRADGAVELWDCTTLFDGGDPDAPPVTLPKPDGAGLGEVVANGDDGLVAAFVKGLGVRIWDIDGGVLRDVVRAATNLRPCVGGGVIVPLVPPDPDAIWAPVDLCL